MTELVAMQDDMKKKAGGTSAVPSTPPRRIWRRHRKIWRDAQSNVADLEDKINQMVEIREAVGDPERRRRDAARLAAIKEQEKEDTSTVVYVPTDSDQYLLGAIIQCEAGGESYDGKLAVGSVVINRVKSSVFSELCPGVIYQRRSVLAGGERQTGVSSGSGCGRKLPSGGAGCAKRQYYGGLPVFQTE